MARGLRRCFGKRAAVVTAITDNPVGRLLEDLMLQGGVSMEYVKWVPYDGIGRKTRVGLNFTERGFGVRAAVGCSDRGHSAASQLKKGDIDWEKIFGKDGVRWFHCGGIYAGLSATTPDVILEAIAAAKKYGTVVSYDLNFRASLWKDIGGTEKAMEVNRQIASCVDVMFGNEEDFTAALGFKVEGLDEGLLQARSVQFQEDDPGGSAGPTRTSRPSPQRYGTRRRLQSTTGARSSMRTANSTTQCYERTSKSTTVWAEATVLPPASSTA